jgi:hypothetical protein
MRLKVVDLYCTEILKGSLQYLKADKLPSCRLDSLLPFLRVLCDGQFLAHAWIKLESKFIQVFILYHFIKYKIFTFFKSFIFL